MLTTTSDSINRPRRVGGLTSSWVQEGATIPSSDPTLDNVSLSLRKLAILVKSSTELYDDAIGLGEWIVNECALAFAKTLDDTFVNGDATDTYQGMRGLVNTLTGTNAASGHTAFSAIDASDLGSCVAAIQGAAIQGSKWFCSPQAYGGILCRLSVSIGGLAVSPQGVPQFLGYDVVTSPSCPTSGADGKPILFFGNLKRAAIMAQRRDMTVARANVIGMDKDEIWLRATWRVAVNVHAVSGQMAMLLGKS